MKYTNSKGEASRNHVPRHGTGRAAPRSIRSLPLAIVLLLILLALGQAVMAAADPVRSYVLSNELGSRDQGGLIDQLIAAGHGDESLYQILQFLSSRPESGISADFLAAVGNSPTDSDARAYPLRLFADPSNNPICIGADGVAIMAAFRGRDVDSHEGFTTYRAFYSGLGSARFTLPASPANSIDLGVQNGITYRAIGVAWAGAQRGDLNHDGRIDVLDYNLLTAFLDENQPVLDAPTEADLSEDGRIDCGDALLLGLSAGLAPPHTTPPGFPHVVSRFRNQSEGGPSTQNGPVP